MPPKAKVQPSEFRVLALRPVHQPIYIRMPGQGEGDNGHCPYTGLSRAMLVALAVPGQANKGKPAVRSKLVRMPGQKKGGVRLIEFRSLLDYIDRHGVDGTDRTDPTDRSDETRRQDPDPVGAQDACGSPDRVGATHGRAA
jgi:hypothetical protein